MIQAPKFPSDTDLLTEDFLRSRFWREVLKPQLDYEIACAEDSADLSTDPTICFKWNKWGAALRLIQTYWLPNMLKYREEDGEGA